MSYTCKHLFVLCVGCALIGCGQTPSSEQAESLPSSSTPQPATTHLTSFKAPANGSNDWAGFRGPSGMGTSSATGLPLTWSATENVIWKTPLPGAGASSPIVHGDRIYLTCYTGYFVPDEPGGSLEDLERHLLAINREDGKVLWKKAVPAKLPEESQIRDHGYAANTPAADDERVYVFFGKSGVFAFDHNGNQQWQADVGSQTSGWGTSALPVLYQDLVVINASVESGSLVALDRATGKEKWRGVRDK